MIDSRPRIASSPQPDRLASSTPTGGSQPNDRRSSSAGCGTNPNLGPRILSFAEAGAAGEPKCGRLTSWIGTPELRSLVHAVDLFVPQFYEGRLPERFEEDVPISDHRSYVSVCEDLDALGRPYMVGVGAYGQALLFDASGRRVGVYRGLSIADAFRHPALRVESLRTVAGERHVRFRALRADSQGRGKGFGILYRIPTAESLQEALKEVNGGRSVNFRGVALFRLPEEGETSTLPIVTLAAVFRAQRPSADVEIDGATSSNPFALIEGGAKEVPTSVSVAVRNVGKAPHLSSVPITVEVRYRVGCGEFVAVDRADRVDPISEEGNGAAVSMSRSAGVRFERWHLAPGQRVALGSVRLREGCQASISELR